jgi:hypothetical protein
LFRIEAHEQFGQHRYDANQHFFAGLNAVNIKFFVVEGEAAKPWLSLMALQVR